MTQPFDVKKGLTDYHCHLLPGLDDGARNLDDSLAMARQLVAAGFREVYCTPHCIRGLYETTREMVLSGVSELQSELVCANIELKLLPGMEYYLDEFFCQAIETPVPLGDSRLLLVEAPPGVHPQLIEESVFHTVRQGFTPLFAHPERMAFLAPEIPGKGAFFCLNTFFKKSTRIPAGLLGNHRLEKLKELGCLFQGNISSFVGYYGRDIQQRAEFFQQVGLYDYFGSDGHRPEPMRNYLGKGLEKIFQ